MFKNSPARFIAPLALIIGIVAVGIVLSSSGVSSSGSKSGNKTASGTTTQKKRSAKSTYVVKSGDSLLVIADKTGVPVEDLTLLNPDVDAQSLIAGQTLKLR